MAIAMKGLRVRPQHEELIGVAFPDGLGNIEFPNRGAKVVREGFILSQLDGVGTRGMQLQQEKARKQTFFKKSSKNKLLLVQGLIYQT